MGRKKSECGLSFGEVGLDLCGYASIYPNLKVFAGGLYFCEVRQYPSKAGLYLGKARQYPSKAGLYSDKVRQYCIKNESYFTESHIAIPMHAPI